MILKSLNILLLCLLLSASSPASAETLLENVLGISVRAKTDRQSLKVHLEKKSFGVLRDILSPARVGGLTWKSVSLEVLNSNGTTRLHRFDLGRAKQQLLTNWSSSVLKSGSDSDIMYLPPSSGRLTLKFNKPKKRRILVSQLDFYPKKTTSTFSYRGGDQLLQVKHLEKSVLIIIDPVPIVILPLRLKISRVSVDSFKYLASEAKYPHDLEMLLEEYKMYDQISMESMEEERLISEVRESFNKSVFRIYRKTMGDFFHVYHCYDEKMLDGLFERFNKDPDASKFETVKKVVLDLGKYDPTSFLIEAINKHYSCPVELVRSDKDSLNITSCSYDEETYWLKHLDRLGFSSNEENLLFANGSEVFIELINMSKERILDLFLNMLDASARPV